MALDFVVTEIKHRDAYFVVAALYDEGVLSNLQIERRGTVSRVGEIVNGLVEKVEKNISGAFVRISPEERAFMPLRSKTHLHGSEKIPVLITKDAHGNKQLTCDEKISFTSPYAVVSSGKGRMTFSKKLSKESKAEITDMFSEQEMKCDVLFRTAAGEMEKTALLEHIRTQEGRLLGIIKVSKEKHVGTVLYEPEPFYLKMLTEMRCKADNIISDIPLVCHVLEEKEYKVKNYEDHNISLAERRNLIHDIDKLMQKVVWLKSGAYLIIEQTEAFVSIDVNSGHCKKGKDALKTYRDINCEAAKETARQLRLRNLSGMILIDFIKMDKEEMRDEVLSMLRLSLKDDPVHVEAVDITKLGIGEVIREKRRASLYDIVMGK